MKGCVHSSALPGKTRCRSRRPEVTGMRFRGWWRRVDGEVRVVDVVDLLLVHGRTACPLVDDNSTAWDVIVKDDWLAGARQLADRGQRFSDGCRLPPHLEGLLGVGAAGDALTTEVPDDGPVRRLVLRAKLLGVDRAVVWKGMTGQDVLTRAAVHRHA